MRIDVSEAKTYRACPRQWQLSSRNKYHLRSLAPAPALAMGTLFHEALGQMYLGVPLEKIMEMIRREMTTDTNAALLAMIPGYARDVLPGDLDRFTILDIEHHFELTPKDKYGNYLFPLEVKTDRKTGEVEYDSNGDPVMVSSVLICGSMDMIAYDEALNQIYVFEHKTCKDFRDETYLWMDEQPRVYTWAAQEYVAEFNKKRHDDWQKKCEEMHAEYSEAWRDWDIKGKGPDQEPKEPLYPPEPKPATLGGVYLNEVKKLLRQFKHKRTLCTYTQEDLDNFMQAFFTTCGRVKHMVDFDSYAAPQPSFMTCKLCAFQAVCSTYKYGNPSKQEILEEFQEELQERTVDHLDEKTERSTT